MRTSVTNIELPLTWRAFCIHRDIGSETNKKKFQFLVKNSMGGDFSLIIMKCSYETIFNLYLCVV